MSDQNKTEPQKCHCQTIAAMLNCPDYSEAGKGVFKWICKNIDLNDCVTCKRGDNGNQNS